MVEDLHGEKSQAFPLRGIEEILVLAAPKQKLTEAPRMESRGVADDENSPLGWMMDELSKKVEGLSPFSLVNGFKVM